MTATTSQPAAERTSFASRFMPRQPNRFIRAVAWIMLLAQSGIIMTGGTVRLTGSGLGCPTWPRCTEDSLTNTQEMGIHGYIEFGNRMLTSVVGAAALLAVYAVWRWSGPTRRRWYAVWERGSTRRDLLRPALVVLAGVVVQAVLGGVTVLTGLHPHQVGIGILNFDDAPDGYPGNLSEECATVAEVCRDAGYATYLSGKWHLAVDMDTPNPAWPTRRGFDRFFGTLEGAGSFYRPRTLVRQETNIEHEAEEPGWFYTDAISDTAVEFLAEHDTTIEDTLAATVESLTMPDYLLDNGLSEADLDALLARLTG